MELGLDLLNLLVNDVLNVMKGLELFAAVLSILVSAAGDDAAVVARSATVPGQDLSSR